MTISIIIPVLNEAAIIDKLLQHLLHHADENVMDIIVCDGGSDDNTIGVAQKEGVTVIASPVRGRAAQMNTGAGLAKGDIFYFVHADCLPPPTFVKDIQQAVSQGYQIGRYRSKYNTGKKIMKLNAWFTRFDYFFCMGGDQTLFVTRTVFEALNGFDQQMLIMEDYEFCKRARRQAKYKIMKGDALISARKYDNRSWLQVQLANYRVMQMYKQGASQASMTSAYQNWLSG